MRDIRYLLVFDYLYRRNARTLIAVCQKRMKVKDNGNVKIKFKTKVKTNESQLKVGKRFAFENACVGVGVAFDFAVELHPLLRRQ